MENYRWQQKPATQRAITPIYYCQAVPVDLEFFYLVFHCSRIAGFGHFSGYLETLHEKI